jgi:hypothetical protein
MPVTDDLGPIVRRDAELVAAALAALALVAFLSFALATTAMELVGLLRSVAASLPG